MPPPKYYRLSPGKEVRLRNAYFITAKSIEKAADGSLEVHCTYDPLSRGGQSPDGRKVKSTMHWVSAAHAITAEIRLYDKLFSKPDPYDLEEGQDVLDNLNPNSLEIVNDAKLEPSLAAPNRATASSSSVSDISASIPTPPKASWSSIAPSR